ncbi:cell division protein SepF [Micromonospora sp. NPDC005707]|uniref:cell division protein SepF n=1 Tax=Micromonospora sp. NPDC005707 TaxID=3157050 RepID=UPI0033C06DE5
MGALRKAGVWLGLVEEDEERAYEDGGYDKGGYRESRYRSSRYSEEFADDEDDESEEPPASRGRVGDRGRLTERASSRAVENDRAEVERPERTERSSVRSITRSGAGETSGALTYHTRDNLALAPQAQPRERAVVEDEQRYQITTLHPTTYREARTIGEHFRDGVPVIINLTEMDEADARRLVDFAAGLAFGLRGTIERVTNRVFLLSPANVQVTAEDKAKIAEGGFFSLS